MSYVTFSGKSTFNSLLARCLSQIRAKNTNHCQGGFLALATAALSPDIKAAAVYHPAMADMEGYLHGRAGG